MDFTERVVLITGAAVGIGRATAMKFAENGAKLVLIDLNCEKLEGLKEELTREFGGKCGLTSDDIMLFPCDISDENAVEEVVRKAQDYFGRADILINNAAIWKAWKIPFVETDSSGWKRMVDINILGTMYASKAVLPSMIQRGYGRIINIGSVAGVYGNANMACYSMTKGAVIAFTKALAKEVTEKGILVNCVSPGSVNSSEDPDVNAYKPTELSFLGRTGTDMENANLICFLASEEASYISGQNIQIDGCRKKM